MLRFVKGHGTQNDFVVLPDPDGELILDPALVRALCDRRTGIGADGVLRVVPTARVPMVASVATQAGWFMDYRNADGSLAEMCGNGVRVYARYLVEAGLAQPGPLVLATRGGIKTVRIDAAGDVCVDMGAPRLDGPARVDGTIGVGVSMGNPHLVVPVIDLDALGELALTGLPGERNIEYVVRTGPLALTMRVHERGVGETRSCGTGVCAAVAALGQPDDAEWSVDVPGGRLAVTWAADGSLHLRGAAELVARGQLCDDWLAAHSGC